MHLENKFLSWLNLILASGTDYINRLNNNTITVQALI